MSDNINKLDYSVYRAKGYPVRHKKKDPFKPDLRLDKSYHEMAERIRSLDTRLNDVILSDEDYLELVTDAYSTNIHWSVKIEGNDLPFDEVRRTTKLYTEGRSEDESKDGHKQEILNHLYSFL